MCMDIWMRAWFSKVAVGILVLLLSAKAEAAANLAQPQLVAKPVKAKPKAPTKPVVKVAKLVSYSAQVREARSTYAKGDFAKAVAIYESIPMESAEYLRTREELAWAYLRSENWLKLRGFLAHLNSDLVPLRWRLEGRVLSAMLHIKNCQYENVKLDIENFQNELQPLAKKVDLMVNRSPNRSYWLALKGEVEEAILKMKFVRMELRGRLVMLTRAQMFDTPDPKEVRDKIAPHIQTFPVNQDIWADELFAARGEGKSLCTSLHQEKVVR